MPLYEKLDDAGFEEFCRALLDLNPVIWCERGGKTIQRRVLSASRLLSGTPQRGADICADVEGGEVWMLQLKHVKDFGPADVRTAVRLMEHGFPMADQYILITTCGLSEESQREVASRPRWMWWDAAKLTTLTQHIQPLEPAINLVTRFFGESWKRKLFAWGDSPLLTWEQFFARELADSPRHFHHRATCLPAAGVLSRLDAFAKTGKDRAMLLVAKGGSGKSRLLLELARGVEGQEDSPRVGFLSLRGNGLSESEADYLRRQNDLALIVDDAHRLGNTVSELARVTRAAKSVRLLIATRPQALESVRSQLSENGYEEGALEVVSLPDWRQADMVHLAERVLAPEYRVQAPRLAGLADRCPLLVILGAAQLNAGSALGIMSDEESFRERVFKGFIKDFIGLQPESNRDRLRRLIRLLAFVSPAPKESQLFERAGEVLECRSLEVAEDIAALEAAGLVVGNREGVRLYPDLFADAVLLDACLDRDGRTSWLCRTVLGRLRPDEFPALLRNVAQADWEARSQRNAKDSLFDPLWTEFSRRYTEATWSGRGALLRQWGGFAMFQPERTLELAATTLSVGAPADGGTSSFETFQRGTRAETLGELPALLEPIVSWHPAHAARALDLLWALDAELEADSSGSASEPINAIARAAAFEVNKDLSASASAITWLERRLVADDGLDRVRRQPWILSALLKPFFGRAVEQRWQTGMTLHLRTLPIHIERTRGVRQRALALVERFACSTESALVLAALPALREALNPLYPGAGFKPTAEDQAAWRPERLEALEVVRRVVAVQARSCSVLLSLRQILLHFARYDRDLAFKAPAGELLATVPDTFELRLARALTSGLEWDAGEEPVGDGLADLDAAQARWRRFAAEVAQELATRHPEADGLCTHLASVVRELTQSGQTITAQEFARALASLPVRGCASILEWLLRAEDSALDWLLGTTIETASTAAPELYLAVLERLPAEGSPERLNALIHVLGWKHRHGGGLTEAERRATLRAAERTEPTVVRVLASVANLYFTSEPRWAMEVLCLLKPTEELAAVQVLRAVAHLTERQAILLTDRDVARCLENLGEQSLGTGMGESKLLAIVASKFPVVVYEHLCRLLDSPTAEGRSSLAGRIEHKAPSLGHLQLAGYLDRELNGQWTKALADPRTRSARLALANSLLWSDREGAADRIRELVRRCGSIDNLVLAVELVAPQGSRFVFAFPELVPVMLDRASELKDLERVHCALLHSALAGARGYTNGDLSPEYRYLIDQAELLANRFREEPVLGRFYAMIAEAERLHLDQHREGYRATQEAWE